MLQFNKTYFLLTVILFVTEVCIALFIHDAIVRPYVGDLLVEMMMYCFFKFFLQIKHLPLAIAVLLFSYLIEFLQYFKIVVWLGLQHNRLASTVIGTSFAWTDIAMYTIGVAIILLLEKWFAKKQAVLTNN